jgi:hypothetical protein
VKKSIIAVVSLLAVAPALAQQAQDQGSAQELANQVSNPVANLISLPFQNNFDFGSNSSTQMRWTMNVQPVIPFALNENWNVITRTIMPINFREMASPADDLVGLGDTSESLFLSPRSSPGGIIWGVGPIVQIPTATETLLGSGKWSAGPTLVVLQQQSGWTYGLLTNQLWSIAGHGNRAAVNATFLQPFLAYNWPSGFGLTVNSETTYDWTAREATVPFNFVASQILKIGGQAISFGAGVRYYAARPTGGPDWGLRLTATLLFPK